MASARNLIPLLIAACALAAFPQPGRANDVLVAYGSPWRYLDDGSNPGATWSQPGFDDSSWATGNAELGYGDSDEATSVGFGPDANNKYITTYFRRTFSATGVAAYLGLSLNLIRDDGAVVYLNGTEVLRSNLPGGVIGSSTLASSAISGSGESTAVPSTANASLLVEGSNTIAVEIHQSSASSSDISFNLELTGSTSLQITRGPYLQTGSANAVTLRWRTDVASASRVRFGTSLGSLSQTADDASLTTEHVVALSSLSPDTRYYYSVGTPTEVLAGDDADHSFVTAPLTGTPKATRIWVLGDSGTGNANAAAVRNAYTTFAAGRETDLWLMLGDNAYNSGTDSEYQAGVFDMYPETLRRSVLWPTLGNHDAGSATSATQSGVYYDIFTLPTAGQAGGVPSGTEAYYSFDYGNIHFVCLNSQDVDRSSGGAMLSWLNDDLLATDADWILAFWHHPPYSKGSHDSDSESQLEQMRENALPLLEMHGVDLVLTGHSHSYERSILLDQHYGASNTLAGSMILDGGDGRLDGNGAYSKATYGMAAHEGAVYAVAGSSGQVSGASLNHPAMYVSLLSLGSMVLDVHHNVLHAKFLDATGAVADHFTIVKGGAVCGNDLRETGEGCDGSDLAGNSCASQGCASGSLACASTCDGFDLSACVACPSSTWTPTVTPTATPTLTPTLTPTVTPTLATAFDFVLSPAKPLSLALPAGGEVEKSLALKVRNASPQGPTTGPEVRLLIDDSDCPSGLVAGLDFDSRTSGDQDSVTVVPGQSRKARLRLRARAADFTSYNDLAPARCTLWATVQASNPGNIDPAPTNDTVPIEINVVDDGDAPAVTGHESVAASLKTAKLRIADGASQAHKSVSLRLTNADIQPSPEQPGHAITVSINEAAGDCPAGSVSVAPPSTRTLAGGASGSVTLSIAVAAADFAAEGGKSPARCIAVVEASTDVVGNSEPQPRNNVSRLLLQVDDRNDY